MVRVGVKDKLASPAGSAHRGARVSARNRLLNGLAALILAIFPILSGCSFNGFGAPSTRAGGPYTAYTNAPITFNGGGSSDPQNSSLTYAWDFGDGASGTGASPTHTYTTAGSYTVVLTTTNTHQLSSTDRTTVTVLAAKPPVANAGGPYTGAPGIAVPFTAAGSTDPQNQTLTYSWNFGDGSSGTGVSPTHIYTVAGAYTVTLTATNQSSLATTATAIATVVLPAQPPVANAGGPYAGLAGTAVTFSGAASTDPRNEPLTFAWSFGDGATGAGVAPSHTYSATGKYTVTLTVQNTDGLTATATSNATITAPQPPIANAGGPYTGTTGTAISFSGAASTDPKNEALTYAWSFGDGSTGMGATPTHTYTTANTYTVTLTVTNTDKLSATASTAATITAAPQAPAANAGGPYTGVAGTAVNFSGATSSDPKSETLTYAWDFGDKTTGSGVAPTHTYAAAGTYTVTLTVTNTDKLSATATAIATITAAPQAPTANAGGPYTGVAGAAVTFTGIASSDPKGEALTYAWDFGDKTTSSGVAPAHIYAAAGTYTVTLTVTNTDRLSATATAIATITAASQAPTANAGGPYTGVAGAAVTFTGAASSDPKNEALTYAWDFGDKTTGSGVAPTHAYSAAGTYTVTLTVNNTDGLAATASTTATITAAPQAPTANAGGPYTGVAGTVVTFTGAASSDPKNETLIYAWDFGDKTIGTGVGPTHTYSAAGTYTVTLTATNTDKLSATATATATITAAPQAPTANAGGPYPGVAGTAVAFTGTASSDPKGETLTYTWDFGDKSTGTGIAPSHTYAAAGTYTVTLTVTNADKLSATAATTATITAALQTPTTNAGGPYSGTASTPVTFTGAGSSDPKGETLTYAWDFGDKSTGIGVAPSHTYTAAGTYTVSLTVKNADGKTGSASTTATIAAIPPQAPTVLANGSYEGTTSGPIYFTALGSTDPANPNAGVYALSLVWSFGDGSSAAGPTPVHTYAKAGTYTVNVTGTSSAGLTASSTTTALISAGPAQSGVPTAAVNGPYGAAINTALQFSSTGSTDPNGLTLTYLWDFGDGNTSSAASPTHAYSNAGSYSVVLAVANGTTSAVASTAATITAAPTSPLTASTGGPYTIGQGQVLNVSATVTNPSNRQLTYTWDFGDGVPGSGPTPSHVYTTQGTYTVSLNVTDGATGTANVTTTATVSAPPAEAITVTANGPYADVTGHAIVLDAGGTQDNLGNTLTYTWNFGDGSTGTGSTLAHTYTTAGMYTATVTATSGTATGTATAQVNISASLGVTITSPKPNTLFANNSITVSGALPSSGLSVTVNGVAATVSGTSFTASGVSLREGVNLLTATANDGKGGVGTAATSVILDVTAPGVSITSPANNATVSTPSVSVAGLVNDVVTGTVGSNDVSVSVNGIAAQVSNRSFLLASVTLVPGANTLTATATDKVGNTGKTSITVNYAPPVNQLALTVLSGSGQSAPVQTVLPQPLVVQLHAADGTPVANRPVTFTVTRSDGMVEVLPTITQSLYVNTDATGKASVLFQLGSRAGLGINQVAATTPGAAGSALFFENTTPGAPTQIHVVRGENQRGLLGQQLAEGLQTIVQDAYGNAISGVAVSYTVSGGDGTVDNASPVTDSNGKALANLTLGQQEGVNNYAVTASLTANTTNPVTFLASGYAPGLPANTKVSGQVLDNSNLPVVNATVRLLNTNLSAVTDTQGHFSISGAPVGTVTLSVDGSTSTSTQTFPFLSFVLESLPGQDNSLNKPIFLPAIDADTAQTVGGDDPVTITMRDVPGVSFTVAPHSVTFPDGSTVGKLSVSQVKADMIPMEPTNGSSPNLIWTLQPAGTRFSTPVTVTFPNTQALAPGTVTEFYQYDHDLEQFVSAGTAHVSADGSTLLSDPGFGITKAGWGHILTATDPGTCVESCVSEDPCIIAKLFANCVCATFANPNAACGKHDILNVIVGENEDGSDRILQIEQSCKLPGHCDINGKCDGTNSPAGTNCNPDHFCDIGGKCNGHGLCATSGTIPDQKQIDNNGSGFAANAQLNLSKEFDVVKKVLGELSAGTDPIINVQPSIQGQSVRTLTCCEAKKQKNVIIDNDTLTPGLQVSSTFLPIILPGPIPLLKNIPGFGELGFYWKVIGNISGTFTNNVNNCTDTHCTSFSVSPSLSIQVGFNFGNNPYASANLNGQLGLQVTGTADCGTSSLTVGLTPIVITGSITLFSYAQGNATFTYTIPNSQLTATLNTTTGQVTLSTPQPQ